MARIVPLLLCSFLISACSGEPKPDSQGSTPQSLALEIIEHIKSGKTSAITPYVATAYKQAMQQKKSDFHSLEAFVEHYGQKSSLKKAEYKESGTTKINSKVKYASFRHHFANGDAVIYSYYFVMENGRWKLCEAKDYY